jgi:hypothetical protein
MPENFVPERYRRPPEDGPEKYAPPHRRPPDAGVANIAQQPEAPAESAEHLNKIFQRVATDSLENIDRVIFDLESVRDMLRKEGTRVSREVSGYANLNEAAMAAMKVIAENLEQWKERPSPNKES